MTVMFKGWAIVEIMGHRRHAGRVSEMDQFGVTMMRLEIPGDGPDDFEVKDYFGGAIFSVSWCDEETARADAADMRTGSAPAAAQGVGLTWTNWCEAGIKRAKERSYRDADGAWVHRGGQGVQDDEPADAGVPFDPVDPSDERLRRGGPAICERPCHDCSDRDHHFGEGGLGLADEEPSHAAAVSGAARWWRCWHCPAWRELIDEHELAEREAAGKEGAAHG